MATIVDSYSETNGNSAGSTYLSSAEKHDIGQAFTTSEGILNSAKMYLAKYGSPTGNVVVKIWDDTHVTGTFGTDYVLWWPLNTLVPVAVSDSIDVSTLTTSVGLKTFTFSGANRINLPAGHYYFVTANYEGGDSNNDVEVWRDTTSLSHAGNYVATANNWVLPEATSSLDVCFYVYKDDATTIVKDIIQPGVIPFPR